MFLSLLFLPFLAKVRGSTTPAPKGRSRFQQLSGSPVFCSFVFDMHAKECLRCSWRIFFSPWNGHGGYTVTQVTSFGLSQPKRLTETNLENWRTRVTQKSSEASWPAHFDIFRFWNTGLVFIIVWTWVTLFLRFICYIVTWKHCNMATLYRAVLKVVMQNVTRGYFMDTGAPDQATAWPGLLTIHSYISGFQIWSFTELSLERPWSYYYYYSIYYLHTHSRILELNTKTTLPFHSIVPSRYSKVSTCSMFIRRRVRDSSRDLIY